jgi:hypothetical protein
MKAKLKTALKSKLNPLFFALAGAALFSVSITAAALAQELLSPASGPDGIVMMMTADGQLWHAE